MIKAEMELPSNFFVNTIGLQESSLDFHSLALAFCFLFQALIVSRFGRQINFSKCCVVNIHTDSGAATGGDLAPPLFVHFTALLVSWSQTSCD